MKHPPPARLPDGVLLRELPHHPDDRGSFAECFRESWPEIPRLVQWNIVRSEAQVFRGFHVHVKHTDYLMMASGAMTLGLRDLRPASRTHGLTALVELNAGRPCAVVLPPGVAHGFSFLEPSVHVYAVSEYWNKDDELACHWNDPEIGIAWPLREPKLSLRDREAGSLAEMIRLFESKQLKDAAPLESTR
jgi:dTDP-4-dehydrorhamnose 3,5-epimerase